MRAYDGSKESIRSTNLFYKKWYNLNIGLVIGGYGFLAIFIVVRATQLGVDMSQYENNWDSLIT